jgi:signal transduction histidine kinase
MSAFLRSATSRATRDVAYLTLGGLTAILAFAVWVTALSVTLSLIVFIIGIPVIVLSAIAFRWTAELDRRLAVIPLGAPLRGAYRDHGARPGLLARVGATVGDPQTWRDLAWLVVHSVVGFGFGVAAVTATAAVIGMATFPLWYWSLPAEGADFVFWHADTLPKALLSTLLAVPYAALTVLLLRGMTIVESSLARALLGPRAGAPGGAAVEAVRRARPPRDPRPALAVHAAAAALAGFVCTLVWGVTGAGYFWPVWVWLGAAITFAIHLEVVRALDATGDPVRALRVKAEMSGLVVAICLVVWALAGGGYLWPLWPALGLTVALALRALWVFRHRLPWVREQELTQRVDELTRTRRGALDVQAAELRRIERDLHDGAQARLVSLSMLMGRAEDQLEDRPELAALVRQAREEAGAAIAELRDLARGIAPPVLADRGLPAAVEALAGRAPMEVGVLVNVEDRPPPVVETAAYFVVAEALTNVAKHAGGAPAQVAVVREDDRLVVEVSDEGPGGADPAGSGLAGLSHRVEALDGTLTVDSPRGGGTSIRAELSCAS